MPNLGLIQPQRQDFTTAQVTDWLDGLPLIATPGPGGVVAGGLNVGRGNLVVAAVDAGAEIGTAQVVTVTAIAGGLIYLTVTTLDGTITAEGVAGAPVYAAGVTFTLSQAPGQTALAVGDTFAVSALPQPVDLSGLVFTLDSRLSATSTTFALRASSAPEDGSAATIANGGQTGTLAMRVPQAAMARCPPGVFPHNLYAADPTTGQRVTAFYGLITHQAVLQP